jgi:hypothetical protein
MGDADSTGRPLVERHIHDIAETAGFAARSLGAKGASALPPHGLWVLGLQKLLPAVVAGRHTAREAANLEQRQAVGEAGGRIGAFVAISSFDDPRARARAVAA